MGEVSTVGIDLAKSVFQVHGSDPSGAVIFRKKLRRDQVLSFFSTLPRCVVAMEACASAHYWAREIAAVGHDTRLIPPAYVKPFVKRQKNDMADAQAICEAAQRPTMRFVQGKSAEAQASGVIFRTRDLLVRQRTQLINALRGHLTEFGYIVRQGVGHVAKLVDIVGDPASEIPTEARPVLTVIAESLQAMQAQIAVLDREIASRAKADPVAKRLMTIPGVGPVIATALVALAPAASTFRRGRDFAAWLGLVPRQHSSGGKERLGRTTKMGERSLRRLLILGASSATKVAARDPDKAGAWLAGMLARKPRMLVTVALANKMARTVWALMAHGGSYRAPAAAV
ncbi:IS110 family transposase [Sphingomonas sp. PP-CC-3G-468]|uniref:IS110 family transposase n=1 Tax=Sphingomonas sp. PP-CC-3G-468 TaxID=2135656 RepID=UPI00104985C7|nr:IS110 family transposase [Sphingomonas sp. PP-CC-3G-468]TCM04779.1 transposase [Sphingomonas sp. PP-CC-3G-468]